MIKTLAKSIVNDRSGTQWRVKADGWEKWGIRKGDILEIEAQCSFENGDFLILNFSGRKVVRLLEMHQHVMLLLPLSSNLATIEWPIHYPLPLLGVVKKLIREL